MRGRQIPGRWEAGPHDGRGRGPPQPRLCSPRLTASPGCRGSWASSVHAVWASDPGVRELLRVSWSAGLGPRLMSQNVHQSPGRQRDGQWPGAAGRGWRGRAQASSPPLLTFGGCVLVRLDFSPLATPLASVSLSSACLRVPPTHFSQFIWTLPLVWSLPQCPLWLCATPEPGTYPCFFCCRPHGAKTLDSP